MKNSFLDETGFDFQKQPVSGKIIVAEFAEVVSTRNYAFDDDILRTLHYHQQYEGDLIVITDNNIIGNCIQDALRLRYQKAPTSCPDPQEIMYLEKNMLARFFERAHTIFSAQPATYLPTSHNRIINDDIRARQEYNSARMTGLPRLSHHPR
ncbi:MAG: hypothetical protein RBR86_05815 [Pseudobdellovibrionaceae bacterium]|jgi:hypothetical protein|nr:hypothetical protein [Pseudobdellovibrionaceae bacterium]